MGGRLLSFLPQWRAVISSPTVLTVISQGYRLKFSKIPPNSFFVTQIPSVHFTKPEAVWSDDPNSSGGRARVLFSLFFW